MFVAEEPKVKDLIGKNVYFGEVLGKHSEVRGTVEEKNIEELTASEAAIEVFEKHLNGCVGWNPLDYVVCEHGIHLQEEYCETCDPEPEDAT